MVSGMISDFAIFSPSRPGGVKTTSVTPVSTVEFPPLGRHSSGFRHENRLKNPRNGEQQRLCQPILALAHLLLPMRVTSSEEGVPA